MKKYVGEVTKNITSFCYCSDGYFGQYCDQIDSSKYNDGCNNGTIDTKNTLTLCNCRKENGEILDEYGWYCDKPNSELCENKIGTTGKPKFYHKPSETTVVGQPDCRYPCPQSCDGCYGFINGKHSYI